MGEAVRSLITHFSVVALNPWDSNELSRLKISRNAAYATSCLYVGAPFPPLNGALKARISVTRPVASVSLASLLLRGRSVGHTDTQKSRQQAHDANFWRSLRVHGGFIARITC